MLKEDFRRAVERELTGREEESSELICFEVYKNQIPIIEQAIETAALMLGTDKSRGYCLEMICADFLAGAHLDDGTLRSCSTRSRSTTSSYRANSSRPSLTTCGRRRPENDSPQSNLLAAGPLVGRKAASRWLEVSILRHDVEPRSPSQTVSRWSAMAQPVQGIGADTSLENLLSRPDWSRAVTT